MSLVVACHRNGQSIGEALETREASWRRQLSALNVEHADLKSRCEEQETKIAGGAPSLWVRSSVAGVGQSLLDVETQIRQIRPRVEKAAGLGMGAAEQELDDASNLMNGYFEALASDLAAANRDLANAERGDGTNDEKVQ